ncbi:MAG: hypothetical protein LBC70_10545 [Chitinispirillales bacterium]|jgi:hypothetical protein|nr:hypothetical protein [Chitinispirillales bacterium]
MKKVVSALVLVFVVTVGAFANDLFFVMEEGKSMTTALLNRGRGKPIGYVHWTVKSVEGSGDNRAITYVGQELDKKRRPVGDAIEHTVNIVDGDVEVCWLTLGFGESFNDLAFAVAVDGNIRIPSELTPGSAIEDSHVYINVATGTDDMGMDFRARISLTDQKCVGIERVRVPAGTFEAYKVTAVITASVTANLTQTRNITAWYARGVGPVKIDTYDERGRLLLSRVLYEKAR